MGDKKKKNGQRQSKSSVKYHGLLNQGATCYLNSVLQVLFMTEDFREAVESHSSENPDTECVDPHLRTLFKDLKGQTGRTHGLTKKLGIHRVTEQQDAAEYFEKILSLTSHEASQIFHGQLTHRTTCSECHLETEADGGFWHLPLELVDSYSEDYSVVEGIKEHFSISDFSGENQMYCDKCDGKSDATIKCMMKHHPDVLMLLLKRFQFDYSYMTYVKINQPVNVPYTLQIPEDQTYELYAVVDHSGGLRGGHYTATIRDDESWYEFNDTRVTKLNFQPFQVDNFERSSSAYLLFYRKMNVPAADTCSQHIREASPPEGVLPDQRQDAMKKRKREESEGADRGVLDTAMNESTDRNPETSVEDKVRNKHARRKEGVMSDAQGRVKDMKTGRDGQTGGDEESEKEGKSSTEYSGDREGSHDVRGNMNKDLGDRQALGGDRGSKPESVVRRENVERMNEGGRESERGKQLAKNDLSSRETQDGRRLPDNNEDVPKGSGRSRRRGKAGCEPQGGVTREVKGVKGESKGDEKGAQRRDTVGRAEDCSQREEHQASEGFSQRGDRTVRQDYDSSPVEQGDVANMEVKADKEGQTGAEERGMSSEDTPRDDQWYKQKSKNKRRHSDKQVDVKGPKEGKRGDDGKNMNEDLGVKQEVRQKYVSESFSGVEQEHVERTDIKKRQTGAGERGMESERGQELTKHEAQDRRRDGESKKSVPKGDRQGDVMQDVSGVKRKENSRDHKHPPERETSERSGHFGQSVKDQTRERHNRPEQRSSARQTRLEGVSEPRQQENKREKHVENPSGELTVSQGSTKSKTGFGLHEQAAGGKPGGKSRDLKNISSQSQGDALSEEFSKLKVSDAQEPKRRNRATASRQEENETSSAMSKNQQISDTQEQAGERKRGKKRSDAHSERDKKKKKKRCSLLCYLWSNKDQTSESDEDEIRA